MGKARATALALLPVAAFAAPLEDAVARCAGVTTAFTDHYDSKAASVSAGEMRATSTVFRAIYGYLGPSQELEDNRAYLAARIETRYLIEDAERTDNILIAAEAIGALSEVTQACERIKETYAAGL